MRSRRRKIYKLFILLLVITLAIFAYVRRGAFFQQAKRMLEENLEKNFPFQLAIGNIRPSLFYGLVLEDLEIGFTEVAGLDFDIQVAEASVDYNLWQGLFSGFKREVRKLRLISPAISLSYSGGEKTSAVVSGPLKESSSDKFAPGDFVLVLENGQISFAQPPALLIKNLQGYLFLSQQGLYFRDIKATLGKDECRYTLKAYGELAQDKLSLTATIEHLQIKDFDILTNLSLDLEKKVDIQEKRPKISGIFKTYGSVLNNQPFPELSSVFEIRDSKLRILTCALGDNYDLRGIVALNPPFHTDLSLNFYQAALDVLLTQLLCAEAKYDSVDDSGVSPEIDFSGLINGLIKITGPLAEAKVEGYLEAKNGHLGDLDFVNADVNLKGRFPEIQIVDSRICREEDCFIMEGELDLGNLQSQDILDLRFKADKAVFWQGWDITRSREDQVHMSKSIADDLKITFDTFIEEESQGYDDIYKNELGLEYRIFGDKMIKLRLRKEEGILGVERRVKF